MSKRTLLFVIWAIMATLFLGSALNFQLAAYEAKDLQRLLSTNRCPGGDLSNADLSGRNLEKANLTHANLRGANLTGANLKDANLNLAILDNAILTRANLQDAKLNHAKLRDANLHEADLRSGDLKFVDLSRASLVNADLRMANLSFANLTGTDLTGANLEGAILKHTDLPTATPTFRPTPTPSGRITPTPTTTPTRRPTVTRRTPPPTTRRTSPIPTPTPSPTPRPSPRPTPTMAPGQGTVSGSVLDAITGEALNQALVEVYHGAGFTTYVTSTTCDYLGIYALSLDPGEYKLVIRMSNYLPIAVYTKVVEGVATYEPQLAAVAIANQGVGTVCGTVTDAVSAQNVSGVQIFFREGVNSGAGPIVGVTTAAAGSYSVNLPAGNYTGEINGAAYCAGYLNVVSVGGRTTTQQSFSLNPALHDDQIRIVLNWDQTPVGLSVNLVGADINDNQLVGYPNLYWNQPYSKGNGPVTVTLLHKSRLKNFTYSIYDGSSKYRLNSAALLTSRAVVRVYEGANLTATFHVPTTQSGNRWAVFSFAQNGITPNNQFCDQSDQFAMQAHDFDGDQILDWVGRVNNQLTVFHHDGSLHTYPINAADWKIFTYKDTDGEPGEEIIVTISPAYWEGYGKRFLIIHDRTQSVSEVPFFENTTEDCLLFFGELDGEPGSELVLKKFVANQHQHILRIISDRGNFYRDYDFSNFTPDFYSNGNYMVDFNGRLGAEMVLTQNDLNGHTQIAVLSFADNRINYYSFDNNSFIEIGDLDGEPGNEIVVIPDPNVAINTGSTPPADHDLYIIHDGAQFVRKYPGFENTSICGRSIIDLDGAPGCELAYELIKDSPYQHIIRIISDRANNYRDYDFSEYGPEFYIRDCGSDYNGRPGNEMLLTEHYFSGGRIAVLSYADNLINNYTIDYNSYWRIIDIVDIDATPGVELIMEADGSPGNITDKRIVIMHDRLRSISEFSGFGTPETSFDLANIIDLDGTPGLELIFVRIQEYPNEYEYTIRILSERTNSYRDYDFSQPGLYNSLYFPFLGELDGQPGSELVLQGLGVDHYEYSILSYRNDRVNHYTIEPAWDTLGVYDFDGQPGQEILLMDYITLRVICDAQGTFIQ